MNPQLVKRYKRLQARHTRLARWERNLGPWSLLASTLAIAAFITRAFFEYDWQITAWICLAAPVFILLLTITHMLRGRTYIAWRYTDEQLTAEQERIDVA